MPRVVPEYKEEAKTRILSAANRVFGEKGYRQATMDDVAKKLGVSKGAIYLYFASKEELFEEICRTEPLAFKEILYTTFSENREPLERWRILRQDAQALRLELGTELRNILRGLARPRPSKSAQKDPGRICRDPDELLGGGTKEGL